MGGEAVTSALDYLGDGTSFNMSGATKWRRLRAKKVMDRYSGELTGEDWDHPDVLKTPYGAFVGDYAGGRYDAICGSWKRFAEKACRGLSPERRQRCLAIFRKSSLYELDFWHMSERPREDLN